MESKLLGHNSGYSDGLFGRAQRPVVPDNLTEANKKLFVEGYNEGYELGLSRKEVQKKGKATLYSE